MAFEKLMTMFRSSLKFYQVTLWLVCLSFLIALLFSCCGKVAEENDVDCKIEYIPIQLKENGMWSFISRRGDIKCENAFKYEPTCVMDGIFSVKDDNDELSVYRIENDNPELVNGLYKLKGVGYINDGLLPICKSGERISIVNKDGNELFALMPIDDKELIMCSNHFSDGMLWVKNEDGKFGYVNHTGKCVIPPIYEECENFSDGKALVLMDSIWRVIDTTGMELFQIRKGQHPDFTGPGSETWKREFKYGRIIVTDMDFNNNNSTHYFMYDNKGNMTQLPSEVNGIIDYNNEYIIFNSFSQKAASKYMVMKDNLFDKGLLNMNGEIVIKPIYESLVFIGKDELLGEIIEKRKEWDEGWETIDCTGKVITDLNYFNIKIQYNWIRYIPEFGLIGSIAGESYEGGTIIQKDGKPIKENLYFDRFGTDLFPQYTFVRSDYYKVPSNL